MSVDKKNKKILAQKCYTNYLHHHLEECLVEGLPVLLAVLPEDELAEVRVVDEAVDADLVGHVDHLLLTRVQTQGLHSVQCILRGE